MLNDVLSLLVRFTFKKVDDPINSNITTQGLVTIYCCFRLILWVFKGRFSYAFTPCFTITTTLGFSHASLYTRSFLSPLFQLFLALFSFASAHLLLGFAYPPLTFSSHSGKRFELVDLHICTTITTTVRTYQRNQRSRICLTVRHCCVKENHLKLRAWCLVLHEARWQPHGQACPRFTGSTSFPLSSAVDGFAGSQRSGDILSEAVDDEGRDHNPKTVGNNPQEDQINEFVMAHGAPAAVVVLGDI